MASPSHRSSASMSTTNLAPPGAAPAQQRRMSLPPPPSPLNLPEPVYGNRRPPSPLRNGFAIDPHTGEVSDASSTHPSEDSANGQQWGQRPISPSPSVTQFAANFAQRVGSLMSNMSSRSPGLPTDEELEAEAERERERSRREAERILAKEAEERRTVEERVMAMLQNDPEALRPPPSRSQTMPTTPPSPSSSQKEGGWWSIAKQRLTPTKEPLTPAQQIIQDTKQREKVLEKEKKKMEKMEKKQKSKDWPTTPEGKYDDPAFIKLGQAASPSRPLSAAPSSPSPHPRGATSIPPSLAPSPYRGGESDVEGASPSRAAPPLYAQFNAQGALDVPVTLLTIARRFEKLEKWTVSHVRALEERMDDVERWLVDKEHEKEGSHAPGGPLNEIREEMAELQGRIGELGREMAKMVTAPGNLASGPGRNTATVARAPSTSSSIAIQSISRNVTSPPRSTPPRAGTTSPPIATPVPSNSRSSRTRLPYPTGDYASPPDSSAMGQGPFSPTNSPPASLTSATKGRLSISGLPSQEADTFSASNSPSGLPNNKPVNGNGNGSASPVSLPTPNPPAWRPSSASPTPRKRYTVALGTQIMARDRDRSEDRERPATPSRSQSRELGTAFFSSSPVSTSPALDDQSADESDGMNEETIGKTSGRHISASLAPPSAPTSPSSSPNGESKTGGRRVRPQSMYAPMTSQAISAPSPITPLNVRLRSRSTDRFGLGLSDSGTGAPIPPITPTSGKFVDPLVIRRQTKEAQTSGGPPPPKALVGKQKVPVGDLVAFFDQEKA
ncbi:hypothetical protein L226DRAFT_506723 [Lentinus tigrinus ALCF2SS1-7]|uniref:Uncharacterized protein n=1 Tax=Lentinus tigrinus ALCF2SS1-6 TaxID=1328759 RepID=A0A5C2SEY9_9APHY|nr:hypothetical protein L227DRAFT_524228 [Lentinus tigrinus ALCF2SS1-6]RPD75987.1 hypothetical protein L226DRAFT_506723 [Lentinus tigrinus ALCF2SS1-7]